MFRSQSMGGVAVHGVCVLWVAGLSAGMQLTSMLEAKELTTHLGSPSSSDPPTATTTESSVNSDHLSGFPKIHANELHELPIAFACSSNAESSRCTRAIALSEDNAVDSLERFAGVHHLDDATFVSQALTLTVPSNVVTNLACSTNHATVTWSAPSASSGCGGVTLTCSGVYVPTAQAWDQTRVNGGGTFPAGASEFCCQATDACSGNLEKCWSVNVLNQTSMQVKVELSPLMRTQPGVGVQRCIEFEVFQNCVEAPVTFRSSVTFGGPFDLMGQFTGIVAIPGAITAQCVTARDVQHSLRSCYTIKPGDCQANGILKSTFQSDPAFQGNWLVGGNLDGWRPVNRRCVGGAFNGQPCTSDFGCPGGSCEQTTASSRDMIDILDFGVMVAEWLAIYDSNDDGLRDGHAPCSAADGNHADINGDGLVDLLDFSFLSMSFLKSSADCCCPGSFFARDAQPTTSISVETLRRTGPYDLIKADVNRDGMIDAADLRAFLQGARR